VFVCHFHSESVVKIRFCFNCSASSWMRLKHPEI